MEIGDLGVVGHHVLEHVTTEYKEDSDNVMIHLLKGEELDAMEL